MLYRIITEDLNRKSIDTILSGKFDSYTVYQAEGVWKGKGEPSLVIEIDIPGSSDYVDGYLKVIEVANHIKLVNHQETVLVQQIHNLSFLI